MRQGLYGRLPFITVGILLSMLCLIPSLNLMTGTFRAVASGALGRTTRGELRIGTLPS